MQKLIGIRYEELVGEHHERIDTRNDMKIFVWQLLGTVSVLALASVYATRDLRGGR